MELFRRPKIFSLILALLFFVIGNRGSNEMAELGPGDEWVGVDGGGSGSGSSDGVLIGEEFSSFLAALCWAAAALVL